VLGKKAAIKKPCDAVDAGLAYLPEDRQGAGIITSFSLASNVTLASLRRYCHPFISEKEENASAKSYVDAFQIKASSVDTPLEDLSGGNQQKTAIAKGLDTGPRIFIFDEPTRGIDIKAKSEVYAFITELLSEGMACMLISSDLEEAMGLCQRIAVMRNGKIAGFLEGGEITEEKIMFLASGVEEKRRNQGNL